MPGIRGDDDCDRPSNDPVDKVCNVGGGVDSLPELPPLGIGYNDVCCTEMDGNSIFVVLLEYTGIRGDEWVEPEPDDNDVVVEGGGNKLVAGTATVEDDGNRCDCEV